MSESESESENESSSHKPDRVKDGVSLVILLVSAFPAEGSYR